GEPLEHPGPSRILADKFANRLGERRGMHDEAPLKRARKHACSDSIQETTLRQHPEGDRRLMKLLNDATEYGLRAVVWLSNQPREPHKVQAIAEATDAARGYLIKGLRALAKAG